MQTTERGNETDSGPIEQNRSPHGTAYWEPETECIDRGALETLQLERLRSTIESALGIPFYRERIE